MIDGENKKVENLTEEKTVDQKEVKEITEEETKKEDG